MTEYVFIPETEFSGFAQFNESAYGLMLGDEIIPITAGATYKILWEDTTYTLEAKELDVDGDIAQYIGNLALLNGYDQTDYPFLFITAPADGGQMSGFLTSDTTTDSHTLGMTVVISGDVVTEPAAASGFEETSTAAGDTVYALQVPGNLPELETGNEYIVFWDGYLYTTAAAQIEVDGGQICYLGSAWFLSGEGEPEMPFIMAAMPPEFTDGENWYMLIATTMTGEEHLIGVYTAAAAKLILRDPKGAEQEYPMRDMLEVDTTDGDTVLYSKGEILDGISVGLDFSEGNQTISAPDGYLVKSAVIEKPSTLVPANIAKDVDIAGIVGTHEGGGGGGDIVTCCIAVQDASYVNATGITVGEISVTVPVGYTLYSIIPTRFYAYGQSYVSISSASTVADIMPGTSPTYGTMTVTEDESGTKYGYSWSWSSSLTAQKYKYCLLQLYAVFVVSDMYLDTSGGSNVLRGKPTLKYLPKFAGGKYVIRFYSEVNKIDLSATAIEKYSALHTEYDTTLTAVYLPVSCTVVANNAFFRASGITKIAQDDTSADYTINLPNVKSVEYGGFGQMKLIKYVVLENCETFDTYSFWSDTALVSADLPIAKTFVSSVFYGCTALTTVNVPMLAEIGGYSFYNCSKLASITLPSVASIGASAFTGCSKLLTIDMSGVSAVPTLGSATAIPTNSGLQIFVPSALYDEWIVSTNWTTYADYIVAV